ncbi:uncharacterized protein LOC106073822 [Biomphalaria glabrata]|uniref:Mannosyltransferase n=1 Tax=Biomphalaria glabrata TaxID=6526 RepID=A0A9W2ZAK9_BIOGL|nr:uncharacterized protein LOC106073822 [Biomphalaria glabrata]
MAKKRKTAKLRDASQQGTNNEAPASHPLYQVSSSDINQGHDSVSKNEDADGKLLPSYFPWIVASVTSVLRVIYVTTPKNWWVQHPDEIFQSMEVAHSQIYGYGLRPYEFMSPAKGDNLSHYQLVEQELGMFAMRSPMLPQFYILVSALGWILGLQKMNPYLTWRISHVIITSLLPVAVSKFTMAVTRSRDIGNIAAALCALSAHLNVFGTHTLVNSFVSPFLFWSLAAVVRALNSDHSTGSDTSPRRNDSSHHKVHSSMAMRQTGFPDSNGGSDENVSSKLSKSNISHNGGFHKSETGDSPSSETDVWENGTRPSFNNNVAKESQSKEVTALSERDISCSENAQFDNYTPLTYFGSGMVLCLSIYIRPDTALLVSVLCCSYLVRKSSITLIKNKFCICLAIGGVVGLVVAVTDDCYFYGSLTLSPLNWVSFNVISGKSGHLFGESDYLFYLRDPFILTATVILLCLIIIVDILLPIFYLALDYICLDDSHIFGKAFIHLKSRISRLKHLHEFHRLCVCAGVLLTVYSYASHKEKRFVHDVIALSLIAAACVINAILSTRLIAAICTRRTALLILLALFASVEWDRFQCAGKSSSEEWPFKDGDRDHNTNECLLFVSQQRDVTGLFMEKNILEAGSFSLLHQKVPLMFRFSRVHIEFDYVNLVQENRSCFFNQNCSVGYYTLNNVADLIHETNTEYLKKKIIESKHYNYAIVASNKEFFYPAFEKVFARKTMSVWRRKYASDLEAGMAESSSKIPDGGHNATLMELEAEILKQMGSYSAALRRFTSALNVTKSKVEIVASMAFCLYRMGEERRMNQMLKSCVERYAREECLQGARVRVANLLMSGAYLALK